MEQETALENQKEAEIKWYENMNLEDAEVFIQSNMLASARSVIAVGYYLKNIRDRKLYLEAGYENIWDYARERFGFSVSTASRYMKRNDRFSVGGNSPVLDEQYREYNKSQLQEMLSLDEEQLLEVTPDMTIQDIRNIRKRETGKEIPYFELEGQLDFEDDFPEILPEPEIEPEVASELEGKETFAMAVSDFLPEEEHGKEHGIAISQQEENEEVKVSVAAKMQQNGETSCKNAAEEACSRAAHLEQVPVTEETLRQPELPSMKNNDQRKTFLETFHSWPIWFQVPEAAEIYYRYDLPDETSLVICEFRYYAAWKEKYGYGGSPECTGTREYLLKPGYHYLYDCRSNQTAMIEKLKEIQKKEK